ncbi:death-associated protein kinase 1-like [Ptychodera flava]|uniref:death-associated protein kinase 1-like n=1 Tax=Ptychodera flava TaxID=63121 RepID=UPI00396A7C44
MQEPGIKRNSSKLNVCGFGGVGKTTLMDALQRDLVAAKFTHRKEEKAPPADKITHIPTPGIDVNIIHIPKAGKYIAWDYAGQPEYYVTHNMFLRADEAVFMVVFKIMDEINDFRGKLTEKLLTWPRFIKSRITGVQSSESKPTVILVASGADNVEESRRPRAIKVVEDIRKQVRGMFKDHFNVVDETFLLNCHDSQHKDMGRLRKCLSRAKREQHIPKLCAKILDNKNKWKINKKFPILYWSEYVEQVKRIDDLVDDDFLRTATSYLDNIGELLFISNPHGDDIIVLNIQWLCSRVFGPMLATDIFLQYSKKLPKDHQLYYSRSDIDEVFSDFADTDLLLNLLKIFELVIEAHRNPSVRDSDVQFIAPALLDADMPKSQWRMDLSKQIYFGRRIQCRDETDSFSPGLFPRLQARLYNHFRDLGQTPSGIWMNGIKVCHVVECLVYMTRGWRAIHICVRAKDEENIGDCHILMEKVFGDIEDVLEICCPGSNIESRVLSAHSLRSDIDRTKLNTTPCRRL